MGHSYLLAGATAGHARAGQRRRPATDPDAAVLARAREIAAATGGSARVRRRPGRRRSTGADVVATDTWVSMGKEAEAAARGRRSSARGSSTPDAARRGAAATRSCCTACPPTAARRSPPR